MLGRTNAMSGAGLLSLGQRKRPWTYVIIIKLCDEGCVIVIDHNTNPDFTKNQNEAVFQRNRFQVQVHDHSAVMET